MRKPKKTLSLLLAVLMLLSLSLGTIAWAEGASDESVTAAGDTTVQPAGEPEGCTQYSKLFNRIDFHPDHPNTYIFINGATATAKFSTVQDCVEVSFSVYTYENTPKPYEDQTHYASSSMKYDTAGSYELTIDMPPCGKTQLDLYAGPVQETLNPEYGHDHLTLRNFVLYSVDDCTTPTPTTTPSESPSPSPTPTESTPPTPTESTPPTPTESTPPTPTESTPPTPTESTPPTPTESTPPTPTESTPPTPTESTPPTPTESTPPTPTESTPPTPTESTPPTPTESTPPTPTESTPPTPTESTPPTPTATTPPTSTATTPPTSTATTPPTSTATTPPTSTATTPPTSTATTPPTPSETPPPSSTPEVVIIEDEDVPADGGPGDEEPTEEVEEETVPLDNLPKTGESSPIPYYLLGTFFTVSGLMALKRRNRSNP